MVNRDYNFIGHELSYAIENIDRNKEIVIKLTQTPFKDKIIERMGNKPIVVRQIEDSKRVILTISYFK